MIYLLYLFFDIILRARSMVQISAIKKPFLRIVLLRTAAHTVLLLSFKPSEYIFVMRMMQDRVKFFYIKC